MRLTTGCGHRVNATMRGHLPGSTLRPADLENGMQTVDLTSMLVGARAADRATRVPEWRDQIAAFGRQAIEPMDEWLDDPDASLGRFAITVLERVAGSADRRAALEVLQRHRNTVAAGNRSLLDATLGRLGVVRPGPTPPPPSLPPGVRLAHGLTSVYHVVADILDSQATGDDQWILSECGWYFGRTWVDAHGGLLEPDGWIVCVLCEQALGRHDSSVGRRTSVRPLHDKPTFVLRGVWHMVARGPVEAPRLGDALHRAVWPLDRCRGPRDHARTTALPSGWLPDVCGEVGQRFRGRWVRRKERAMTTELRFEGQETRRTPKTRSAHSPSGFGAGRPAFSRNPSCHAESSAPVRG